MLFYKTVQILCTFVVLSLSTQTFSHSNDIFSKPELCKLLVLTGLPCEKDPKKIVEATQKNWLREHGKERWEIQEKFKKERAQFLPLVDKLGFVKAVNPQKKNYDYALVMGALSSTMKQRLAFLVQQWKEGVRFKQIFFLVGERPRDPLMESPKVLFEHNAYLNFPKTWAHPKVLPQTEAEIAKMIYTHGDLPKEFRKIPLAFVNTPMKKQDGKTLRPTTLDTINDLFAHYPIQKGASILSVSNQPYILYQHSVLEGALPNRGDYLLETVGYEADKQTKLSVYLDSIARTLYIELPNYKGK